MHYNFRCGYDYCKKEKEPAEDTEDSSRLYSVNILYEQEHPDSGYSTGQNNAASSNRSRSTQQYYMDDEIRNRVMRTYIAPIGYDSTRVTRPILSQGIERDTCIELLIPAMTTDDSRSTQAIDDVRRMIEQIEPDVGIETTEISHDNFEEAIETCGSVVDGADGEVVVVFGGGARDIF